MTTSVPVPTTPQVAQRRTLTDTKEQPSPVLSTIDNSLFSTAKTDAKQQPQSKKKSHGRKTSWEAFDPLLAGDVGKGVWGTSPEKDEHPLHSNPLLSPQMPKRIPPRHRKVQSAVQGVTSTRRHRKTNSTDELRQIAQQLAKDKPAAFEAEQEKLVDTWADGRVNKIVSSPVVRHRHTQSLGMDFALNYRDDGLVRSESQSLPTTPEKKKGKTPNLLTPPWTKHDVPPPPPPDMPTLTPLHGYLTPKDNLTLRSSEQDPSLHQIEIPSCDDLLMHSRLCAVLDQYRVVDQNFDYGALVKTSRMALQGFVSGGGMEGSILQDHHKPIIKSLLECSDDLVLEGFFCTGDSSEDRVEAAVYNIQSRRQFVVVYRGTTEQQTKPVRNKQKSASPIQLHPDQPVSVFPAFRDAYFRFDKEGEIFGLLDQLSEQYPFCDVVFTGHAFGGALATIAALRFASAREMMRVSCHAFGSPKVGASDFKACVNSQANLKVMRVEHAQDASVAAPDAHVWMHVGHTILVNPDRKPPVAAYRFEKGKPVAKNFLGLAAAMRGDNKSHDIQVYVKSMEQFARLGLAWVTQYVGQDVGTGVRGTGNEKRQMV